MKSRSVASIQYSRRTERCQLGLKSSHFLESNSSHVGRGVVPPGLGAGVLGSVKLWVALSKWAVVAGIHHVEWSGLWIPGKLLEADARNALPALERQAPKAAG